MNNLLLFFMFQISNQDQPLQPRNDVCEVPMNTTTILLHLVTPEVNLDINLILSVCVHKDLFSFKKKMMHWFDVNSAVKGTSFAFHQIA